MTIRFWVNYFYTESKFTANRAKGFETSRPFELLPKLPGSFGDDFIPPHTVNDSAIKTTPPEGLHVTEIPGKVGTFPLRLPRTTRFQANELAQREGLSLNHFISLAVAEKIARLEDFFGNTEEAQEHLRPKL